MLTRITMVDKTLSHYKILEELGRGGMGIVYKGEDTKLHRTVAIKVLPAAALSSDGDRARFYREARAAASLSHPNIAVIHEIDEAVPEGSKDDDLLPFIAMEFIEGDTLEDRIKQGPMKLDEAVRIASEIASALEAAHENDIVHRDIKAANVMLTAKGSAKVLDFGLAQTAQSTKLTRMGSALGTVAYMSPEQARGEEVDRRTDIWALGVTLYEMIAGKHPFGGDYEQAVVYTILNETAEPLTAVRTGVPMELEQIVDKCLRKEREHRYQNAAGLIADLRALESGLSLISSGQSSRVSVPRQPVAESPQASSPNAFLVVVALLLILAVGWFAGRLSSNANENSAIAPIRFSIPVPGGYETPSDGNPELAISDDGMTVVYREDRFLVRRSLGASEAVRIPGTEFGEDPVISPDGQSIGFLQDNQLKRATFGGVITNIGIEAAAGFYGLHWTEDDRILAGRMEKGIGSINVQTGAVTPVTEVDESAGERGHVSPQLVDGGKGLIYSMIGASGKWHDSRIVHLDLTSGKEYEIVNGAAHGHYVSTGHVLFVREDAVLQAVPYDLKSHETGTSFPIASNILLAKWGGGASYVVSPSGTLITAHGNNYEIYDLNWYDRSGVPIEQVAVETTALWGINLDSSGRRLVTTLPTTRNDDVFVIESGSLTPRQVTNHPGSEGWAVFSPDGTRIAYQRDISGGGNLVLVIDLENSEPPRPIYESPGASFPASWTPDGKWLLIAKDRIDGRDIVAIDVDGTNDSVELIAESVPVRDPQLSPDGRFLAYTVEGTDGWYTRVVRYPDATGAERLPGEPSDAPQWNPAADELFYWQDKTLVVAHYSTEPVFRIQRVDTLFTLDARFPNFEPNYAVRHDGEAFLIKVKNQDAVVRKLDVVLNAFEMLKGQGSGTTQ